MAFFEHLLAFSDRKIQGFLFVFQPVNSSIRSIIRQFSIRVNNRKTSRFPGVYRLVNALKTDCFSLFYRRFPVAKQRVNWSLLGVLSHCPGVHRVVNAVKTDCFQLFYRRFPVAKQRVNWSLLGVFSHCPGVHRAVNAR